MNTKTSLEITMEPDGEATIDLKWDDRDSENRYKASERIIRELIKIPDYNWLHDLLLSYFADKYCVKCSNRNCTKTQIKLEPFPYCFSENISEVK